MPKDGCPARAGMDPGRSRTPSSCARLPRTRGDGPGTAATSILFGQAAPHARVWQWRADGGCPARAGMDPLTRAWRTQAFGLPRTRGDGLMAQMAVQVEPSVAPRARGWARRAILPADVVSCPRRRGVSLSRGRADETWSRL